MISTAVFKTIKSAANSNTRRELFCTQFKQYTSPSLTVRFQSTPATTTLGSKSSEAYPKLQHVPSYPYVGSMIPPLSGVPSNMLSNGYSFWMDVHKKYGDFFTFGLPSLGAKDSKGTVHMITDPREMVKVVRSGGKYPSGVVESMWVTQKWFDTRNRLTKSLFKTGPEWKRLRSFIQTDLMQPQAANGYVPAMIEAAKIASDGVPTYAKGNMKKFFTRCSFDLFCAVMFGEITNTANPTATNKDSSSSTRKTNEMFVDHVSTGLSEVIQILFDPFENAIAKPFGFTTKRQQTCFNHFDKSWEIAMAKVLDFCRRKDEGTLSESEKRSYLYRAVERQKEGGSDLTLDEVHEICFVALFAAIDTTSSVLAWNIFHLARCPNVQQKLYDELSHAVATIGNGAVTPEIFERENSPYLHACIRESYRISPTGPLAVRKRVDKDVEVNGVTLKPGEVVGLLAYCVGMNHKLVDDPEEFIPERWLSDAVAARKGTEKEIIDHPYLKDPFSQGARMCPGSRVATNEMQVVIAQLVLDWKMESRFVKTMKDASFGLRTTIELDIPEIRFERRGAMKE